MAVSKYYAHSCDQPETDWQTLADHLRAVGDLAAAKATHFGAEEWAEVTGLLHDLGKYCPEFQQRLRGSKRRVDHATWGAKVACAQYKNLGVLLAYAIAGHHAGLADGLRLDKPQSITPLADRLAAPSDTELDEVWQSEITLKPRPAPPPLNMEEENTGKLLQMSVLGRMLYSCLVDADFLDTEAFYNRIENTPRRDSYFPSIVELKQQLDAYLSQPRFNATDGINGIRQRILSHVRQQAEQEPGLFSLNVPTGGGKTLASLAFALDHAVRHGKRRVILVIPFTSIVEQNARVWREALGPLGEVALIEHHSAYDQEKQSFKDSGSKDKLRQAAENWEAPIVVTTAVQFFESLYANRSSRCRKLHNIANSVVILDEAQTLPVKLLQPCIAMVAELARNYRTSLVLCTATQPALRKDDNFRNGLENVRELAPDPKRLHAELERVSVRHVGALTDDELLDALLVQEQVLCIVNNRRHARSLFEQLRQQGEAAFHLTTLMCARHRSAMLEHIRQRLLGGLSVRLVSTSLIEAGVDISFPTVYRADAGLDSIAQAAGRCNREGRFDKLDSRVNVFTVADDWTMPAELEQYAQAFHRVYRQYADNLLSLDAIRAYFSEVYWVKEQQMDAPGILGSVRQLEGIPYEQMARGFRMIESNMLPVIVPYDYEARSQLNSLVFADRVGGIARKLQPYLVQVPEQGLKALMSAGAVQPVAEEKYGYQFLELVNENLYDAECGLSWDEPGFVSAEKLVL